MTQSFQIQCATPGDAMAIAHVNFTAWQETYRGIIHNQFLDNVSLDTYYKRWLSILKHNEPKQFVIVIKDDKDKVMGYCTGGKVREEFHDCEGEIYALYLLREYHGKGLGSKLFETAVTQLKNLGFNSFCVFVLKENPTIGFYRHYKPDFEDTDVVHIGEEDYDDVGFAWHSFNRFTWLK